MSLNTKITIFLGVVIFIVGLALGIGIGNDVGKKDAMTELKNQAIKEGAARYNPTNGEFQFTIKK